MNAATKDDLFALLDRLGVEHHTLAHQPVFTVAESAGVKSSLPGGHTKNLFLKDRRGELWLVCALADSKIDLAALAKALGAQRFSFGAAELMVKTLGVTPGAVTAFAVMNDRLNRVSVVLDRALMGHQKVNFHPLANDATTALSPQGLLAFLAETGHPPQFVDFDAAGGAVIIDGVA